MAMNNNTTATSAGASSFLASLFAVRPPTTHADHAEITDWEFVNDSDLSDDDLVDSLSDSESEKSSTLISVSFVDDRAAEDDHEDRKFGSVAVVGIRSYGGVADILEDKESTYLEEEEMDEDPESEEEDDDDLDDELVPWSVSDRFGRQRMRKLGTRAFAKMNKTTKKFAYTVNRPGCVRGKHGLGRRG